MLRILFSHPFLMGQKKFLKAPREIVTDYISDRKGFIAIDMALKDFAQKNEFPLGLKVIFQKPYKGVSIMNDELFNEINNNFQLRYNGGYGLIHIYRLETEKEIEILFYTNFKVLNTMKFGSIFKSFTKGEMVQFVVQRDANWNLPKGYFDLF